MLYKYLSLSDRNYKKRVKNIFLDKEIYAAKFDQLNDPMEGVYLYDPANLGEDRIRQLSNGKQKYNILSLSSSFDETLLWSHYADGHKGIAIGLSLGKLEAKKIGYVEASSLEILESDTAEILLTRKLKFWEYEKEYRVLVQDAKYVPVEIKEIWLGINVRRETETLIQECRDAHCKDVEIKRMERSKLNNGILQQTGFLP